MVMHRENPRLQAVCEDVEAIGDRAGFSFVRQEFADTATKEFLFKRPSRTIQRLSEFVGKNCEHSPFLVIRQEILAGEHDLNE
jgi:hypothetical protein